MEWSTKTVIAEKTWLRIGLPLWWRHFFVRFGLLATALSAIAFGLFIFVDLLAHIKDVFDPTTNFRTWRDYYICMLSSRLNVVLPFSLTTAAAILIPRIIRYNELIPLFNAGISLRQIVRPFLAVALFASLFLWGNAEFVLPRTMRRLNKIVDSDFGRTPVHDVPSRLGVVLFDEGSRLFFSQHDPLNRRIDDAFWVRSTDCVLHVEQLFYFKDRSPEGHGVDVIERDPSGRMKKTASYPFCELSQLKVTREAVRVSMSDPKTLSLLQLGMLVSRFGSSHSERATETTIAFYSALLSPLLAWLAVLIPAPLAFRFERRYPQALIVFVSLAALFCFLLVIHASVVLARVPGLSPTPILILPWLVALFLGYRRMYGKA